MIVQRVPGPVPYSDGLAMQRALHARVADGESPDTVLLLEHEPVYTAGKRTEPWERPTGGSIPVVDVDRGGRITWHGPGQVTGYPVLRLADPVDVVAYVRALEQVLLDVCAAVGVTADRVEGRSGVWTPDGARKIAAVGIRVARGTTMHGFALNCDNDLDAYDAIVACGIRDATVTTLSLEAGRHVGIEEVLPLLARHLPALSASTVA